MCTCMHVSCKLMLIVMLAEANSHCCMCGMHLSGKASVIPLLDVLVYAALQNELSLCICITRGVHEAAVASHALLLHHSLDCR